MFGRTLAISRKEFLHIIRDPRTLAMMFLIPIVQLILLGYAATTDIQHLRTAVLDSDRSSESRALVDAYRAMGIILPGPGSAALPEAAGVISPTLT